MKIPQMTLLYNRTNSPFALHSRQVAMMLITLIIAKCSCLSHLAIETILQAIFRFVWGKKKFASIPSCSVLLVVKLRS